MVPDARAARVLVLGHACVDLITLLERAPAPDEKLPALDAWLGGGGPGANAAVALARLGHEVTLLTALGDDEAARVVRSGLEAEGVRVLPGVPRGRRTAVAQIQAVGDQRSVVWSAGDARLDPEADLDLDLGRFELLYLDTHQTDAAHRAFARAVDAGVEVFADLGSVRPGVEAWIARLPWVATSARFARELTARDRLDAALQELSDRSGGRRVVVTLGRLGAMALVDGRLVPVRPRKVGVVDTTAAGDAFHAGLADAHLQGMDPLEALEWASTLGAAVCRGLGGRWGLPVDRARLRAFHDRWPTRPVEPAGDLDLGALAAGQGTATT